MSIFQRRHYEWLAEFCGMEQRTAANFQQPMLAHAEAITSHLIERLAADYSGFKPDRFRQRVAAIRDNGLSASKVRR